MLIWPLMACMYKLVAIILLITICDEVHVVNVSIQSNHVVDWFYGSGHGIFLYVLQIVLRPLQLLM